MVCQSKPIMLCDLCEKVYDPNRGVWTMLTEYHASYGEPVDSYAFTETFCDACHVLYSVMLGTRKEPIQIIGSPVGGAMMATASSDSIPTLEYGYA